MSVVGTVDKLERGFAIVTMERQDMCGECHACELMGETKKCTLKCVNSCHSKIGDKVEVDVAKASFLKATLIMYGLPLLGLLLGIGMGYFISELASLVLGIICMGLIYAGVKWGDKKNKYNKMLPAAVRVLK
ncbi:SoxR reducing system RseC family protein [Niameybacter massiliensis]|uniref:SoxR reducing system RseC family protein n=1 Tax=Holtiella tumoricola TaxID=3018743 RepID=A0AA42DK84_9FIRM|nr:SoxR reducing system RseC family protein [Holtiella tumoricola]MDA3730390.1 SoxR reducing system RseC family protein [Holtiella tumoricola]